MLPITNIAAYKFARLENLKPLRQRLLDFCKARKLRGTILISVEGINLFVAGGREGIEELLTELRSLPGLEELKAKYSESDAQPFNRMLVRIKKEIIAFGVEGIDPATRTSEKLPPHKLKQWLDEGRPVTLLDTRNDYEVKLGTFHGAKTFDLDHFRNFPAAVDALPEEMKDEPIVMFCTGGIRCEKAGPYMESRGFRKIFQLEGGILKYFEDCGSAHYDGECFVFDQRVGVDPALHETGTAQCFACQAPLTDDEQSDPRYVPGKSCPHCYRAPEELMRESAQASTLRLQQAATPLPGSTPYENRRPFIVPQEHDGGKLLEVLTALFAHESVEHWQAICADGRMEDANGVALTAETPVFSGQRIYHRLPMAAEPDVASDVVVLHEDEAIVILNKPAPLPMHPCGRFNRNTLQYFLDRAYDPQKIRPAHRLDANTTGVLVCARTRHFARLLQPQFERGEVEKVYLARIQGTPAEERFVCTAPISAEPGELGSRVVDENGLSARTEFAVKARFSDGTSLVEARPLTGRTNQIRVHLWSLGWPVVGDPAYLPEGRLGDAMTLAVGDAPLCLHAWRMEFTHPVNRKRVTFEAPAPDWAA